MDNAQICQRCAMPLEKAENFGTNADGGRNEDYCCFCYKDGAFFYPKATMEDVIEGCISEIVPEVFPDADTARGWMNKHFPTLKCWKKTGMIISFKLKDEVSEEDFLAASDEIQENYISKCKGFLNRQLMKMDGVWTDWVIWETLPDAENSMSDSEENELAKEFTSLIGEVIECKLYPLERNY